MKRMFMNSASYRCLRQPYLPYENFEQIMLKTGLLLGCLRMRADGR